MAGPIGRAGGSCWSCWVDVVVPPVEAVAAWPVARWATVGRLVGRAPVAVLFPVRPPVVRRPLRDATFRLPRRDDVVEVGPVGFAGHAALLSVPPPKPILSREGRSALRRPGRLLSGGGRGRWPTAAALLSLPLRGRPLSLRRSRP